MDRQGISGIILLSLLIGFTAPFAQAATITSTATGGVWATGSTWVGGVAPATTDGVVIATTGANSVTLDAAATCAGLTINSGSILTVGAFALTVNGATSVTGTLNHSSATGTRAFNGDVIINSGGVWNETAAAVMTFSGNFMNNATTFTASTGTHTFSGTTMTISGATATSIANVAVTGTYTNSGTLTVGTALSGAGRLTNDATGTLNIGGTSAITTLTATAVGNTVNYTGAAQTVKATTYYNLTLSGSGTKTFPSGTTTVDNIISVEGTFTSAPTFTGTLAYGTSATLQFNRTTSLTANTGLWPATFTATGGVIISNSGTNSITTGGAKVFSDGVPLTITSSGRMSTGNQNLTFGGNYVNDGNKPDFGTTTTITINGSGAQNIAGLGKSGTLINTITMAKTSGTATFTGQVYATGLTINGSGGTLDLGSGLTHTVTNVTVTAGTLNGGSSTLNVSGTWTGTTGFTASTSTINYTATGAQTIGAVTYNNLTLSGSGAKTMTSVSTINGNFTVSGTASVTAAAALTIGGTVSLGSGTTFVAGSYTHNVAGDWTNNGATFTNTGSTINLNGSTAQTIGGSAVTTFNNLTINKSSNDASLGGNAIVDGTLNFASAHNLALGANTLTIGASGSVTNAAANQCVVTDGAGVVSRSIATGNFTFPIGHDATHYNPVNIANAGSAQTYTARVEAGTNPLGDANTANTCGRTWTLTGGGTATIAFYWNTAEAGSALQGDAGNATAWSNNGSGWVEQGGGTSTGTPNVTTVTGITTFSSWLVGTKGALPIQMASFAANVVRDNQVEVAWRTVSETNNYGFEIYRKRGEAGAWAKIGFVQGHGTTLAPQSYTYTDAGLSFGKYYYQIRQVDLDGKSQTFPEMSVTVGVGPEKFVLGQNYPNPFNPTTQIEFVVPQRGYATLKVYNVLGQEVATLFEGTPEAGSILTVRFNVSQLPSGQAGLPSGIYFYTLRSDGRSETKRMLLMK